jgi:hypothetical protein
MDQRHAEKGVIAFFSCGRRRVVAWVGCRVRHGNQFATFTDQTRKSLVSIDADLAYGCRVEAICCHQDVLMVFHICQIHGAGIDGQGIPDPVNDDIQGIIQVFCGADFLDDLSQSHKHRNNPFIWHPED